jgi:DNA-binding CsgD family transcriptional regulator
MAECDVYPEHTSDEEFSSSDPLLSRQEPRDTFQATVVELDFAYKRERREADRNSRDAGTNACEPDTLRDQAPLRSPHPQELPLPAQCTSTRIRRNASRVPPLSPREADTLRLVMTGAQTKEVASELGIDELAVKDHIKSILRKLQAKSSHLTLVSKAETGT